MRDIVKYRGRRKDTGEWVKGYYWKKPIVFLNNSIAWSHYIYAIDESVYPPNTHNYLVIPETVGEYTGLNDKNGVEIYGSIPINGKMSEGGDKMCFKADKSSPSGGHYCGTMGFHPENTKVVEWDEGRFMLGSFDLRTELKMYEVIGSIHDEGKPCEEI